MPNTDCLPRSRIAPAFGDILSSALTRALALLIIVVTTTSLMAHPDLLAQIERLNQQIAADPGNAQLLARRGDLHRRHRDYAAASRDLEAARAADPAYAPVDFFQGSLFLDTGQPARAAKSLGRYLDAHPENAAAWLLRARAWLGLNDPATAAEHLRIAISASDKPGPELYRLWVLSLAAQGREYAEAALRAVDAGLERFPVEISLLGLGVDIALGADRSDDAIHYIHRLPGEIRRLPQWQVRQGRIDCLQKAAEADRVPCLREARQNLERRIETFLSEHAPGQPLAGYSAATN